MGIRLIVSFMLLGFLGSLTTSSPTQGKVTIKCGQVLSSKSKAQAMSKAEVYTKHLIGNVKNYLLKHYDRLILRNLSEVPWLQVQGISSLERVGKANLSLSGQVLTHEFQLVFPHIHAQAMIKRKVFLGLPMTGRVHASIDGMKMYGKLRLGFNNCIKPKLEKFKLIDLGVAYATIEEGNWIAKIASWFPRIIIRLMKKGVPKIIEKVFDKVLTELTLN